VLGRTAVLVSMQARNGMKVSSFFKRCMAQDWKNVINKRLRDLQSGFANLDHVS
jgi:hypothetical protein